MERKEYSLWWYHKNSEKINQQRRAKRTIKNLGYNNILVNAKARVQAAKDRKRNIESKGFGEYNLNLRDKRHKIDSRKEFKKQGGLCAVGGEPLPENWRLIHVDHNHDCCSGQRSCEKCFRGLVCGKHNRGLGHFNDDWELLEKASKYIFNAKVRYLNGN